MSISLSHFCLYSTDTDKLASFLSFIFDIEIQKNIEGHLLFSLAEINFQIESGDLKIRKKNVLNTVFSVDTVLDLEDLAKSVEFYYYKNNESKFFLNLSSNRLIFSDPSNNHWRFAVRDLAVLAPKNNELTTLM